MHSKILYQEFLRYALFLRHVVCIWMRKKLEPYYFLCELSHQQRNNISGISARYKLFGVNGHKEIIMFKIFYSSKYKIHVALELGGKAV